MRVGDLKLGMRAYITPWEVIITTSGEVGIDGADDDLDETGGGTAVVEVSVGRRNELCLRIPDGVQLVSNGRPPRSFRKVGT